MIVNGALPSMEIDNSTAVSIISQKLQKHLFLEAVLKRSDLQMKTYTEEPMSVLGHLQVQTKYGEQEKDLRSFVVSGNGPSLLRRT
jgi:hypothetical protein